MALAYFRHGKWIVTDTPANLVTLIVSAGNSGSALYSTLMIPGAGGNAPYQVPAGKTLTILGLTGSATVAGNTFEEVGYGDTSVASSAGRPTTPIYFNPRLYLPATIPTEISLFIQIPALKYPYAVWGSPAVSLLFHGYVV